MITLVAPFKSRTRSAVVCLLGAVTLASVATGCGLTGGPGDPSPESVVESAVAFGSYQPDANYPWVVRVGHCQGSLISPTWVATAGSVPGSCIDPSLPLPHVSYSRTDPTTGISTGVELQADNAIPAPDYPAIALVHLPHSLQSPTPDPLLQPIHLPRGFPTLGQTGVLANPNSQTVPAGQVSVYDGTVAGPTPGLGFGVYSPTEALCFPDLGGGFVVNVGGTNFLLGVLSYVSGLPYQGPCDPAAVPGALETMGSVYSYDAWIRSLVFDLPEPPTAPLVAVEFAACQHIGSSYNNRFVISIQPTGTLPTTSFVKQVSFDGGPWLPLASTVVHAAGGQSVAVQAQACNQYGCSDFGSAWLAGPACPGGGPPPS